MRISVVRVKQLCRERNTTLTSLLRQAKVSRNAFYTLARAESILPRSARAIAGQLKIRASELLTEDEPELESMKVLLTEVETIVSKNRRIDRDNVRHTLILLREKPIIRLRRALQRSQKA